MTARAARRTRAGVALAAASALVLSACSSPGLSRADDGRLQVISTTGIIADIVKNVGGDRVSSAALIPPGADPHSYEPTFSDIRNVAYADVGFSNYALLEEHNIIKTLDANIDKEAPNVSLAEGAVKYAAEIIPLIENVALDTVWLGLRVQGTGEARGATRSSSVRFHVNALQAPEGGRMYAYLTESFGNPEMYLDSSDGIDPSRDVADLPADAHTHMTWAFTQPGVYEVGYSVTFVKQDGAPVEHVTEGSIVFAVGVDAKTATRIPNPGVLGSGHADVTANLDKGTFVIREDVSDGGAPRELDPAATVVEVPNSALNEVPTGPQYRFLGADRAYLLQQAVLGKHVHGEIDPHLWHDVRNVQAYAKLIRDTLIREDPAGRAEYTRNTERYVAELDALDKEMFAAVARIPEQNRRLVTTHDGYAYLAKRYGLDVTGFVTPNPATEPSVADRIRLLETVRNLKVPAVFLEPTQQRRSSPLNEVARETGTDVCTLFADAFDRTVTTYIDLMRANARELERCLG